MRRLYAARRDVAYAGADYRVYGFMRVADAMRFYGAIHARWDAEQLDADLRSSGLGPELEVRRMKTVYQRVLVLALLAAARPEVLIVERADQFDVPPAEQLLERVLGRVPRSVVTYAPAAAPAGPVAP